MKNITCQNTNNNLLHSLPVGPNPPTEVYCLVEIPKGKTNKYEYDRDMGVFKLDRVLYEAVFYPAEYGIIPQTFNKADDDPVDIMVLSSFPTFPGCLIACRPIGVIKMIDTGQADDKIIAVPTQDPRFEEIRELGDLTPHLKKELVNFWENYAELQTNKKIKIVGWGNKKAALNLIKESADYYKEKFPNG